MGFMAIVNLIAILILGKWALLALDDYSKQRNRGLDPVFLASSIHGLPETDCWHEEHLKYFGSGQMKEYLDESVARDVDALR